MILLNLWCNRVFQWEILKAYLNYDAVFSLACCIRNILGYLFFSVNAGTSGYQYLYQSNIHFLRNYDNVDFKGTINTSGLSSFI